MNSFKLLWSYLEKYKLQYLSALIVIVAVSLMSLVGPYFGGQIVDLVIEGGQHELLLVFLGIIVGVAVVRLALRYYTQMTCESISQKILHSLRLDMYKKLQSMDFDFYDSTKVGDLMTRMANDTDLVRHMAAWVVFLSLEQSIIFIGAFVVMLTKNIPFTMALLLILPFVAILAIRFSKEVRPAFQAIRTQFSRLNTVVQENISGNRVVRAFAKEDYEKQKFNVENERYRQANRRANGIAQKYLPILSNSGGILTVYMIIVGGFMVINEVFSMGDLVMFNGMIWMLTGPLNLCGNLLNDMQRFFSSADKICELRDLKPKIETIKKSADKKWIEGNIDFKNVNFKYKDRKTLHNISFSAKAGQTIALIGPTGSGKSTLTSLISRFYDVESGEILIDGVNIKDYDVKILRENVSVAQQDIFLFSDTIEGNIAYGAPHAPMEDVKKVAVAADAHGFIEKMPEGYNTIVGERGVGLSGGQRQRIALARALLANPAILVLDDTTSSVDMETEQSIFQTLKDYYSDRTTFVIAHRISSVKNADLILVLDNGRIIERGNHEQLLAQKGYYWSVFENQCGDFNQE